MPFTAGIDLGTTFTAAAINRDGRVEMFRLGSSAFTVPSVLYFGEGGTMTTGDTARRRLMSEPDRVAHEFKRRMGDPAPLMIGGAPYAAHLLTGRLLDWVVDRIEEQEGERPALVTVTHPANWGPFRRELMDQAIKAAEVDRAVTITEPEAAAIAYATAREVPAGSVIAVYDLGGGTFDAAVLRRKEVGFELIGTPDGVEHLGGLDFDATIYGFVVEQISDELDRLDPQQASVRAAVQRLKEECVSAKIALSTDTDATIPVILPGFETQIRITRSEFEQRITPLLSETIGALSRTLRSAGVEAADLDRVLLVGGSSRIPLVGRLVTNELGRPVAIDSDPKNAIARGAAIHAQTRLDPSATATFAPPSGAPIAPRPTAPRPPASPPPSVPPHPAATPPPTSAPTPAPAAAPSAPATPPPAAPQPRPAPTPQPVMAPTPAAAGPSGGEPAPAKSKTPFIIGGVVGVIALIAGIAFATAGGDGDSPPDPDDNPPIGADNILAVELGDCLNIDARNNIDNVDCDATNIGEVYFIFESELGPERKSPFPGPDDLFNEGQPVCDAELATATPASVVGPLIAGVIASDEDEWVTFDSRRIVCLAEPATNISAFRQNRCYDRETSDDPAQSADVTLTITACQPPFFGSVYLSQNFAAAPAAFPGFEPLLTEAIPICESEFEPQTDTVLADSGLVIEAIIPNEAEWDAGHRFFACGSYAESGIVSFAVGQCTRKEDSPDDPTISLIFIASCVAVEDGALVTLPHAGEVIAQVPLGGADDAPFPGFQPIFDEAQPLCDAAFEPYVGTALADSSLLVFVVAPGDAEWTDLGVRKAACAVERIDGAELDASVLQSGL